MQSFIKLVSLLIFVCSSMTVAREDSDCGIYGAEGEVKIHKVVGKEVNST